MKGVQLIFMHYVLLGIKWGQHTHTAPADHFQHAKFYEEKSFFFSLFSSLVHVCVHFLEPFIPVEMTQENWCCRKQQQKNPFRSFHNGIIAFVHISNEYETFIFKQFANLETHTRRATDALKQQQQQHEYSMKWKWKKEDAKNAHDHNVKSLDSMLG